jgi:hypothetical protein
MQTYTDGDIENEREELFTHEVELEPYEVADERRKLESERNSTPVRALHDNPVMTVRVEGSISGRRLA